MLTISTSPTKRRRLKTSRCNEVPRCDVSSMWRSKGDNEYCDVSCGHRCEGIHTVGYRQCGVSFWQRAFTYDCKRRSTFCVVVQQHVWSVEHFSQPSRAVPGENGVINANRKMWLWKQRHTIRMFVLICSNIMDYRSRRRQFFSSLISFVSFFFDIFSFGNIWFTFQIHILPSLTKLTSIWFYLKFFRLRLLQFQNRGAG